MKTPNFTTADGAQALTIPRHRCDAAQMAFEEMRSYCVAHPGSPAAVRLPVLSIRRGLWMALLGPSVEEGIVGIGSTVEAALRAFDTQYLAGLRPPSECHRHQSRSAAPIANSRAYIVVDSELSVSSRDGFPHAAYP